MSKIVITEYITRELFDTFMDEWPDSDIDDLLLEAVEQMKKEGYDVRPHPTVDEAFIFNKYTLKIDTPTDIFNSIKRLINDIYDFVSYNGFLIRRDVSLEP